VNLAKVLGRVVATRKEESIEGLKLLLLGAAGPDGKCVCPNCGRKVSHQTGQPCYDIRCPKCGTGMTRG